MKKLVFLPVFLVCIFLLHFFTMDVHAQTSSGGAYAVFNSSNYTAVVQKNSAVIVPHPADGNVASLEALLTGTYSCRLETPNSKGMVVVQSGDQLITLNNKYYSCPRDKYNALLAKNIIPPPSSLSSFESMVIWVILWTLSTIANFFIFLLRNSSSLLVQMIGQGSFIENELVKEAWPFVQGIANLGFIFALLYIALATTLRLESVTTSVQRLLPKLLLGALLVNFSLVIGGVLIDASRLMMAIETNFLGSGEVTYKNLGVKLIEQSGIYNSVFTKSTGTFFNQDGEGVSVGRYDSWSFILQGIQSTMFIIFLAAGMVVIALGLFWRYIMLLLLLIASPLAYAALALPKTAPQFSAWWKNFIKWVVYGPTMLFILILITKVQASSIVQPLNVSGGDATDVTVTANTPMYQSLVSLIVVVALMFLAAKIAKSSSGMFADSFMGFMKKTGNAAIRNPKTALLLGSGGAAAPVVAGIAAAQYFGRGAANQVGDFNREVGSGIVKNARKGKLGGIAKFVAGVERDKDGKPKKDADPSGGLQLAGRVTGYSPTLNRRAEEIRTGTGDPINARELTNANLVARLDDASINAIANNAHPEQFTALVAALSKDKDGKISDEKAGVIVNNAVQKASAAGASQRDMGTIQGIASNAKLVGRLKDPAIEAIMTVNDNKTTENLFKSLATEKKE